MEVGEGGRIEEMQGWDGPYSLSEYVLQQVWARGEFLRAGLRTEDGRKVVVDSVGRWNRGSGPDFSAAVLFLDGVRLEGSVEIHLRPGDWDRHGHASDPAYSGVVLHVVLFPGAASLSVGWAGGQIPILVLLPHLFRDLEDYALDFALERALPAGAGPEQAGAGPHDIEPWIQLRWQSKLRRARGRWEAWGWDEAQHATALEVLGYAANRGPMLQLAQNHPFGAGPWPLDEETLCAWRAEVPGWFVRARPANSPATRVRQYALWRATVPDWTERLRQVERPLLVKRSVPGRPGQTWVRWLMQLNEEVAGGAVPMTRWQTWVLDAALPFWAVSGCWPEADAYAVWRQAPVAEVDDRTGRAVSLWQRERHPSLELTHGLVQGWRQWRAAQAEGEGETGARGLTSLSLEE